MKKAHLRIVTENQENINEAKALADDVANILQITSSPKAEKYLKEDYSFKIEFDFELENPENSIAETIEIADRICTPWILSFDRDKNEIELILNKYTLTHSTYRDNKFNTIAWALMEVE